MNSFGYGMQPSLLVYPGTSNYLGDEPLGWDVCAYAYNVAGFQRSAILAAGDDDGSCSKLMNNDCLTALKTSTNAYTKDFYRSSTGSSGTVKNVCNAVLTKLNANIPDACQSILTPASSLIVADIAPSQPQPPYNLGANASVFQQSCSVYNGYERWYNIYTQFSGPYSEANYDLANAVVWPIMVTFFPPINSSVPAALTEPETNFNCLRTNHYNPGSRVSPVYYTNSTNTTTTSTPTPTPAGISGGVIAGIVVAAVAALLVVLGIFWFIRRRKRQAIKEEEPEAVEIYTKEHIMNRKYSEAPSANGLNEMSPDTYKSELPVNFSAELHGDHHYELEGSHTIHELPANQSTDEKT